MFFQVNVNDMGPLWFCLDSGAGTSYIDTQAARRIGLEFQGKRTVQGVGEGRIEVNVARDVRFELPGLVSSGHEVHATDLGGLGWARRLDGFLGYDFLERFVVACNYDVEKMVVSDPQVYHYDGPGAVFPLEFPNEYDGRLPFVKAVIQVGQGPGQKALFLVDSGSQDEVNHCIIAESGRTESTRVGVGLGAPRRGIFGRVDRFQLGPFELTNLHGVAGTAGLGGSMIGGGVLSRFTVIFDYARKRMILEKLNEGPRRESTRIAPRTSSHNT